MLSVKQCIKGSHFLQRIASYCYRLCKYNSICSYGSSNSVKVNIPGLFLSHSKIRIYGSGNTIEFSKDGISYLDRLKISIHGNNNIIIIGQGASCSGLAISIENDENKIVLGTDFHSGPNTELACIEGTSISFGNDCMLSANIILRTGDSHSVIDLSGHRINHSKSISIGDHVWVGNTVLIFKGTNICSHSVIAGGSVVTGKMFSEHCIIGGNPAKVIKEGIDWCPERI